MDLADVEQIGQLPVSFKWSYDKRNVVVTKDTDHFGSDTGINTCRSFPTLEDGGKDLILFFFIFWEGPLNKIAKFLGSIGR